MQAFILALLPLAAFADHAPAYGHHAPAYAPAPAYHCRDTNTSVYAEVCVPAFTNVEKEVVLAVKVVEDNDYCYEQITTVCSLTTKTSSHELCTYSYQDKTDTLAARVTQVGYVDKSETMKVTSCKPSGYGDHYGAGEHQYCREEYQTQAYKVPTVDTPLDITVDLTNAEPVATCVVKVIEIDEVVCEDVKSQRCFNVARLVDSTNTIINPRLFWENPNVTPSPLLCPPRPAKKPIIKQ
jgi:hypothetical protein